MRYILSSALLLGTALFLTTAPVASGDSSDPGASSTSIVYKPPMRGAPLSRVGGGTRGGGDANFVLDVLAPDHTGLTTKAQPTLYWYASGPSKARVEVTVIADNAELPVLTKDFSEMPGGVHSIDLAKYELSLKPDTEYEWYVSVVPDSEQRSKDITSSGTIRRVSNPAILARATADSESAAPRIYAEAGLWYDAIDSLSRLIERNPNDAGLRAQRAALLNQVGLPDAAAFDSKTQ